jgi:integrase
MSHQSLKERIEEKMRRAKQRKGLQTRREDIVRFDELNAILKRIDELTVNGEIEVTYMIPSSRQIQRFKFKAKMIKCLIALLWLFGRRKIEVLKLKRKDVEWDENYLYVHFPIRKARKEYEGGVKIEALKKITRRNPLTNCVIEWVQEISDPASWIFPGDAHKRILKTVRKWRNREGEEVVKVYTYIDEDEGYLSRETCWKIIKYLDRKLWVHLFRKSVATLMAERGASEDELMAWFDWASPITAHKYVRKGTKLIERWTERIW